MKTNLIVGIDVSKDDLDYAEKSLSESVKMYAGQGKISNTVSKIKKYLSQYDPLSVRIVLEPTGTYSNKLQTVLDQMGFQYHCVNPKKSHHYALSKGIINKTDDQAARMLAEMGQVLDLPIYVASSQSYQQRKQLLKAIAGLEDEVRRYKNKLHALTQLAQSNEVLEQMCIEMIASFCKQKKILEKEIKQLDDQEFAKKKELATSVKGVGDLTATWLLTITNGLENFEKDKQVIKFLGLAPGSHRSGSSVNKKSGINKGCAGKIRGLLYMASQSAIRFNPACKALYERLRAKGKNYYQAIVAVMCKLIKQVFAVVKSGKTYDEKYHLKFQK